MDTFPKVATEFDQIIQKTRDRKKNEQLANEIFGRNKQKTNNKRDDKRPGRPQAPSLASRVGIAKRSSSTSSNNPPAKFQPKPRSSLPNQTARANRLAKEINNGTSTNLLPSQSTSQPTFATANTSSGISIKGASGPFVLHASNFAPGTTAADIESALHPDTLHNNGVSSLVSCKLVNTKPDVVAELVFTEKIVAESIISKYNGQKADGRILRVELVRSGVGSMSKTHVLPQQATTQAQTPTPPPQQQSNRRDRQAKSQPQQIVTQEPEVDFEPEIEMTSDNAMEDVAMDAEASATDTATNFIEDREAADRDRDRRDRDTRRDRDRGGANHYDENKRRGGDDDSRRRDDRDRERGDRGDRERPRGDREYERRAERPRNEDRRGGMSSHYGNGVGGMQRGGAFGGPAPGAGGTYGGGSGGGGGGGYRGGRFGDGYGGGRGGGFRGGFRGYR